MAVEARTQPAGATPRTRTALEDVLKAVTCLRLQVRVVVRAVELDAGALQEVVVAGLLAVKPRVVDDPGLGIWGRYEDV